MESKLPEEQEPVMPSEPPDPESIPDVPMDTSAAFSGGVAPVRKDPEEMVQMRAEGSLPAQESETSLIADAVAMDGDKATPE